jgi:hypothetical protein
VRLAAGAHALFVRFDCRDPQARATFTARDAPLWQEDAVEVFLAAGVADPETYIELEVNPLGALFDARVANPGGDRSRRTRGARISIASTVSRAMPGTSAAIRSTNANSVPGLRHFFARRISIVRNSLAT